VEISAPAPKVFAPLNVWVPERKATLLERYVSESVPLLMLDALSEVMPEPLPLNDVAMIPPSTLRFATAVASLLVIENVVSAVSFS
jgi:hypothetical protein